MPQIYIKSNVDLICLLEMSKHFYHLNIHFITFRLILLCKVYDILVNKMLYKIVNTQLPQSLKPK